jgi:hypothetical protein
MALDGIWKLHNKMACSGGEISILRNHLGGHAGEREGGGGGQWPRRRWRAAARLRRACRIMWPPPPWGPLYIGGRGAPLPLPQGTKAAAKGGTMATAVAWGGARPVGPQYPNPGRLGLWPLFFPLMGLFSKKRPIRCFPYFNSFNLY